MRDDALARRLDRYWAECHGSIREGIQAMIKEAQTLRTQYKVGDFLTWQRGGELKLNPNFQRRPVWTPKAKSFLIDTILRGMPVPIIFLRDTRTDVAKLTAIKDVVDGQQRLRTIISFIAPHLLADLEPSRDVFTIAKVHNSELAGASFRGLSPDYQQRILDYQFSVHVFSADTADADILQIFARMNATGMKVNPQELRNAQFFGDFKTAAYELAAEQLDRWRQWNIFTAMEIARMSEVELVSEFMLLIMNGELSKRKNVLDKYYELFDEQFSERNEVARRLRLVLDQIESMFTKEAVAATFNNRTLFYALFAIVYGAMFGQLRIPVGLRNLQTRELLKKEKAAKVDAGLAGRLEIAASAIKNRTAPKEVLEVTRGAVTDAGARRTIIEFLAGKGNSPCPAAL